MLKQIVKKKMVGKAKYQSFWEKINMYSLIGMNLTEGGDCGSDDGEEWVLNYLSNYRTNSINKNRRVIFDVGANVGKWSRLARKYFPDDIIYAFEPAKDTYNALVKNCQCDKVICANIGLGENNDDALLYSNYSGSGLASLYNRDISQFEIQMDVVEHVKIESLDRFCTENDIERIFFLKLDVEGNELSVLKNSMNMINNNAIDWIQMEFGGCNIDSRTFFRDFWRLLFPQYKFHRIVKDGLVEIKSYEERHEQFLCSNLLLERVMK